MKVLVVCSGNVPDFDFKMHQSFIYEQIESIKSNCDINYDVFFIRGKKLLGYLKNIRLLKLRIRSYSPDLVHAHFGLSGLLAIMQFKAPVVVTFHGSDCNYFLNSIISNIVHIFARYSIFVTLNLYNKLWVKIKNKTSIIKCGLSLDEFIYLDKYFARSELKLDIEKLYILFASSFDNKVKNYNLAEQSMRILNLENVEVIELKNKTRAEVNLLLNSVNLLLLTSFSEGSPQIIKEAMACKCPIVATDVGDIKEIIGDTDGCYITTFDPNDVAEKIKLAIEFSKKKARTNGREKVLKYDNKVIASKIYKIYEQVIEEKNNNN